jgi:deoxycytidylate deaminase
VSSGKILATGVNIDKNDPMVFASDTLKKCASSIHAEHRVLKFYRGRILRNATIYVARVNRKGETRMSRPCNLCYVKLLEFGIKEVVYTI